MQVRIGPRVFSNWQPGEAAEVVGGNLLQPSSARLDTHQRGVCQSGLRV